MNNKNIKYFYKQNLYLWLKTKKKKKKKKVKDCVSMIAFKLKQKL